MKHILKYGSLVFLLVVLAGCGDNFTPDLPTPGGGGDRPGDTDHGVVLLDEQFNDRNEYLTVTGTPYPDGFTNGYFERTVGEVSFKTYLTRCELVPDRAAAGAAASSGAIIPAATEGAIETALLGSVTGISMTLSGSDTDRSALTRAVVMIKTAGGQWETFAESPAVSGDSPLDWTIEQKVMRTPVAVRIVQDPTVADDVLSIFDLKITGTTYREPQTPEPTDILFKEGFYNDGDGIKTFFAADGTPFPGGSWGTTEGYFERSIGGEELRVRLIGCSIDYTRERISINGESTSKGCLQIGALSGGIEFPVLATVTKVTAALSAGTSGNVATRALLQYRHKGTTEWVDVAMSPDVTANDPLVWEVSDVSFSPAAIRIIQDPAITSGNALVIFDLTVQGTLDTGNEEAIPVTLMNERFRELNLYVVTETGGEPDRTVVYDELHFDRVVEGRTLRTKMFNTRIQNTSQPPANANGATQGRLMITPAGWFETPIYGSVISVMAHIGATDPGKPTKAILQVKKVGEDDWTEFASTDQLDNDPVVVWQLDDITDEPAAIRILPDPGYTDNFSIYNIVIVGTLY